MKEIKVFVLQEDGVSRQIVKALKHHKIPHKVFDIRKNDKLAYQYDIMASPTVILEEDNTVQDVFIGYSKEIGLHERVKSFY